MNRILVIGGTGNVGRHVAHQLAATGARFRAMTRSESVTSEELLTTELVVLLDGG